MADNCQCAKSFAVGLLIPLIICLLFYLLVGLWTIYYTYRYRSVDLNSWLSSQKQQINRIYQSQINFLNNKINQLN